MDQQTDLGNDPEASQPPDTAKQLLIDKEPQNNGEQLAVLGHHLHKHENMESFKVADLAQANIDAGGSRIGDARRDLDNATRSAGLFVSIGKSGHKKLSMLGEQVVEAMPDRAAVKELQKKQRPKRRTKKAPTKKAK